MWRSLNQNVLSSVGLTTKEIATFWEDASNKILHYMKLALFGIGTATVIAIKTIGAAVMNIGKMFYNAGIAAKNMFLIGITALVNKTIDSINAIGDAINFIGNAAGFGDIVGKLKNVQSGAKGVTDGFLEMSNVDFAAEWAKGMKNGEDGLKNIRKLSGEIAKDRLKDKADELKADRNPKAGPKAAIDKSAENRAQALRMVNLELDNELKRMQMLKPEREIQQRMDQIEQQLASKKIKLSQDERAELEKKVRAIQDFAHVQQEMDRIYEDAVGPARTMNAAIDAATKLYDLGAISADRYAGELYHATEAFKSATSPTYELNKAIDLQMQTLGLYGDELEKAIFLQKLDAEFKAKNIPLYDAVTGKINAEAAALIAKNNALRDGQYIQSQVAAVVDPMIQDQLFLDSKAKFYAEIDRMRTEGVLKEEQAERAKAAIRARYNEINLRGASTFFGEMASLSSSGNKKLAAIGKAAAIAQATIDGFVAVQKALASAPPPWNIALAAAVAVKTGVQVAGIMSTNVGSFQSGGAFMVDGKAGVDNNNINMNVSRGERVTIETPAQQRSSDRGGNSGPPVLNAKIVNIMDPREALHALDTAEGEELIVNIIERKSATIKPLLG